MSYDKTDIRTYQSLTGVAYNVARRAVEQSPRIDDFGSNMRITGWGGRSSAVQYLAAMAAARGVQVHLLMGSSDVVHPLLVELLARGGASVSIRRHLSPQTLWADVSIIEPGTATGRVMVVLDDFEQFCPSTHMAQAVERWAELVDDEHTCVVVSTNDVKFRFGGDVVGDRAPLFVLNRTHEAIVAHLRRGGGDTPRFVPWPEVPSIDFEGRWSSEALDGLWQAGVVPRMDPANTSELLRREFSNMYPNGAMLMVPGVWDKDAHGVLRWTPAEDARVMSELLHRGWDRGVRIWSEGRMVRPCHLKQPAELRFAGLIQG